MRKCSDSCLQVHYATVKYIPEDGDDSGVILHYTNVPQPRSAGVYYTGSNGRFPGKNELTILL